jgi:hypothetical protein
MLDNPNVDEQFKRWLDTHPTPLGPHDARNYWLERYSIVPSHFEEFTRNFSSDLLNQSLAFDPSCREVLACSGFFIQYMWHDLELQGAIDLSYQQDDYYGDRMNARMGGVVPDLDEFLTTALVPFPENIGWLTRTPEIGDFEEELDWIAPQAQDAIQNMDLEEICEELEYERANQRTAKVSGYAIAFGYRNSDLEIRDSSTLFPVIGENNLYYVLSVTGEAYWEGIRYEELSAEQQKHLALNIHTSSTHPFIGQFAWYLLACMAMHDKTHESVIETLKSFGLEQLEAALNSRS